MKAFMAPLQGLAEFEQIKEKSKTNKGILQVSGCMESQKSHLMYGLSETAPYRLILAEDERRAREIYEDYRFYDEKIYSYPAKDLLFFQADIHGNLLIRQRMKVIRALLEEKELTVVTSIDGCMDFLEPLEKIKSQLIHYENDSTIDMDQLKNKLVDLGYERVGQVESRDSFLFAVVLWISIASQRKIHGESNCGGMRLILYEVLTLRARDPSRIWRRLRFIRQ